MYAKKLVKWGVALTSTLILGGVVGPEAGQLLGGPNVVYAQTASTVEFSYVVFNDDGMKVGDVKSSEMFTLSEEDTYSVPIPPTIDGYQWVSTWYANGGGAYYKIDLPFVLKHYANGGLSQQYIDYVYKPVEKTAETPTEKPAEQPADQPATPPTDQPVEQPISVAIIAISEADGPLSHYYVTINPGETKTVEAPKVDGYKLDQYAGPTYELTYDYALGLMNSGGSAWVQFWMIKDTAPETPVDQPVEQPAEKPVDQPVEQPVETPAGQPTETPATTPIAQPVETPSVEVPAEQPAEIPTEKPAEQSVEQPVETPAEKPVATPTEKPAEQPVSTPTDQPTEQPVEKPVETPTEKPTATSLLAGNTASKAQTGATADKKKVDNSTPSTNAVKSEEGSQATAKTLPKTGDSSSMLLVLGGFLSGLSGLGLAATSRKRD
ncbi:TPA: LPXTG cell wall anchor domain-containing protein [Streptococcus suis]|nr:LPXTG cell wall anchor domain-containing protein [Streptococcus suis]HEM4053495.1 LPXTG cell wall anchor domain-containing protein [Streptococcus suis]